MDLQDIGEFELIRRIRRQVKNSRQVLQGIGDDAAVLRHDKKSHLLLTTDALVENVHFRRDWSSPEQIGRKAVEVNVSDIAAMGGLPTAALVSLILPASTDPLFVERIYRGIRRRCRHYRIDLVGGNISRGKELSISITLLGRVERDRLCLRSGAGPDELVCVTGKLGKGQAGLMLCSSGDMDKDADKAGPFLRPRARLQEGRAIARFATSLIDISDGLVGELHRLMDASGVGFLIDAATLPLHPLTKLVDDDPRRLALFGGDELELLFTIRKKDLRRLKVRSTIIGRTTRERRISVQGWPGQEDARTVMDREGYDHFLRRPRSSRTRS
ncbi:MAG: thiamine-phosphate kinase [DPANN group archaeon]|nr:thiamine-phosphate kinase [DPANN group archaeon]